MLKVVCVDLLDSPLVKLRKYSREYNIEETIQTEKADIGYYKIGKDNFDFIVAVSALEHVHSEKAFEDVIQKMAEGTKLNGINCLIVNSEVEEIDIETNKKLDAQMEVSLSTENMINKLSHIYLNWKVLEKLVKPLAYNITRNGKSILLKTNAITYVVRKDK